MVDLNQIAIENIIIDATSDLLKIKLRDEVDDDAKAGLVRPGKLQDDPTTKKINILIHPGGEEWPDKLNSEFGATAGNFAPSAFSIGGYGSSFWRRYVRVELQMFYPNENNRESSRLRSNLTLARAKHAIHTWKSMAADIGRDSFGESAISVTVKQQWLREGGGQGDFNWRGEMIVEFLTEFEPEN